VQCRVLGRGDAGCDLGDVLLDLDDAATGGSENRLAIPGP